MMYTDGSYCELLPSVVSQSDFVGVAIVVPFEGSVVAFMTNVGW